MVLASLHCSQVSESGVCSVELLADIAYFNSLMCKTTIRSYSQQSCQLETGMQESRIPDKSGMRVHLHNGEVKRP